MENNGKKRILVISSASPTKGPGTIGLKMYETLRDAGYETDMLTLYQESSKPEIKYIYKKASRWHNIIFRIYRKLHKKATGGYCFFYRKEKFPPIKADKVLSRITKHYDIVLVYFWQGMLSFHTIEKIYDKLKCRFVFVCADYSPMSGGCHFIGDCKRFQTGCGCCPAFNSKDPNDFTSWNVKYRKRVYEKVKPIISANTYMIETFFKKSYLLRNQKLVLGSGSLLDLDKFRPLGREQLLLTYHIPINKKNVIAFGCQSLTDKRKGMSYLLDALKMAYTKMTDEERDETLLLFIGRNGEKIMPELMFDYKYLGIIPYSELPSFYSVSTMFLCSSVDDAGPSMLGQSIACGTPLVAFEMGAALDNLRGKNTGYCAKLRDSADMANGILNIVRMPQAEYAELRKRCRELAEKQNSPQSFVERVINA